MKVMTAIGVILILLAAGWIIYGGMAYAPTSTEMDVRTELRR